MGGPEGVARQPERGKLTVRERLALLADPGTFREIRGFQGQGEYDEHGQLTAFMPAGQVDGTCRIDGRKVVVTAGDFTVRGGSADGAHGRLGAGAQRQRAGPRVAAALRPPARRRRRQRAQLRGRSGAPTCPTATASRTPTSTLLSTVPVVVRRARRGRRHRRPAHVAWRTGT